MVIVSGEEGIDAPRWPVRVGGTKTAAEMWLELRDSAGRGLGMVHWRALHKHTLQCWMMVYSTTPRDPVQPVASVLSFKEMGMRKPKCMLAEIEGWAIIQTPKKLALSSGEPLFAWARVRENRWSMDRSHFLYLAESTGAIDCGKGMETFRSSKTMLGDRISMKMGGRGCLIAKKERADGAKSAAWSLAVAAGIDPLLMLTYVLLNEKDNQKEHYVHASAGQ